MLQNDTVFQNRYRVIEPIGRGGMGAVYKAMDTRLRTVVALKQTLVEGEPLSKAFEREARLLASLRHSMLPRVSDHFIEPSGQFLVMEYIPGDDLGVMLEQRKRPFDLADVLRWADQLLDVLDYLHTRTPPVIHRDIKPQNVKLTDRNEIILLDFGLAKGSLAQTRATSTGSIFGYTPHYAPLEQIYGTGTDHRSDLYGLAATLYHLLTGQIPVDALARAGAKVNEEPDPLARIGDINPNVPPAVAALLHQAMSLKANDRPPTAAVMRSALRKAVEGAALPGSGNTTIVDASYEPPKLGEPKEAQANQPRARRPRWLWAAVAVPVLLAIGAAGFFTAAANWIPSQPSPTSVPIAAALTHTVAPPTNTPSPTIDLLAAAGATQTATAQQADATSTAIAAIINNNDATRTAVSGGTATAAAKNEQATQTAVAIASAEAATQAAIAAANAEAATQAAIAAANAEAATQQAIAQETAAARPTATPRPTRTPAPPTTPPESTADCRVQGRGSTFVGSCSPGSRLSGQKGSCITGRVLARDGTPFQTVLLSVDIGGSTIRVPLDGGRYDPSSGNYSVCGLRGGEWGVTVINVNRGNGIEGNPDQAGSQVIVRLSGADGEHAVISFRE